jgi:pimeloyl-ACP methyl ester carboxylesterase
VWLVGHSLGGTLAFDTALREETRISGVAMIAPFFDPVPRRTLGLTPKQWYRVMRRAFPGVVIVDQRTPGHPHLDGKDGPETIRTWPFLTTWDYEGLFDAADAVRDRAGEWHGPLRVDIALDDEIVDTDAARRFFRGATNAVPALLEAHPSGHVLPLSSDAESLARDIARFFSGSRAAAAE